MTLETNIAAAEAPQANNTPLDQDLNFSMTSMMPSFMQEKSPHERTYGTPLEEKVEEKAVVEEVTKEEPSTEGEEGEGDGEDSKDLDTSEEEKEESADSEKKSEEEEPPKKEEEEPTKEEEKQVLDEEKQDILDIVNKILGEDGDNKEVSNAAKDLEKASEKANKNPTDKNIEVYKDALKELKNTMQDERFEGETTKRENSLLKQRIEQQDDSINKLELESMQNKPLMKIIKNDEGLKDLIQTLGAAKKESNKDLAIDEVSKYMKTNYDIDLKNMIKEQLEISKKRMQTNTGGGVPAPVEGKGSKAGSDLFNFGKILNTV